MYRCIYTYISAIGYFEIGTGTVRLSDCTLWTPKSKAEHGFPNTWGLKLQIQTACDTDYTSTSDIPW